MIIKMLENNELQNALDLVWNVFQEFESPEYDNEGIQTFREFIQIENIMKRCIDNNMVFWGAYDNNEIIGVIAIRDIDYISLFFVKREFHKQGIGKKLFQKLVLWCKTKDVDFLTVHSSPYAVHIYHKLGFVDIDVEQILDGIRFTPMKYMINKNI